MQKPRAWVERLLGSVKQQKESDRVTCKQNSSTTDGKSRSRLPHLLLLRLIRSAKLRSPDCPISLLLMTAIRTAFARSCWGRSGPQSSRVRSPSLATAGDDLSMGFACLLMALEGLGSESLWKWWARGSGFPHENFSPFHPCLPLDKGKFHFCLAWLPPQVASF